MAARATTQPADTATDGARINQLKVGAYVTLSPVLIKGSLQARKLSSGQVVLYWRHTSNSKTARLPIGTYDSSRPPLSLAPSERGTFSIKAAAVQANSLASKIDSDAQDHQGSEEIESLGLDQPASAEKSTPASPATLSDLLKSYVSALKDSGRVTWKQVENSLNLHVLTRWPQLVEQAAKNITTKQLLDVLRPLHKRGIGRQANKIRAYLRAAFERALNAENNPAIDQELAAYGITSNPAAAIAANTHLNRAAKNPLSKDELIRYWKLIKKEPGMRGHALRLHLLSGSPRIAQLIRLKTQDINADLIRLEDRKGRPGGNAREHILPLTKMTRKIVQELASSRSNAASPYVLSTTHGKKPNCNSTMTHWAADVVGKEIAGFQLKRVRSGVETILASLAVSEEVRGHLQSHGISGLQNKHYNGYEYFQEKLDALNLLFEILEEKQRSIRRKKA
ncbi:integrase [Acidovorax delafieldii]|uniref:Integrase n=1 Tax=Acidovorax delafieldii TaxID=47920 RepID=A0AAJ2BV33_ACIDE|nr:integrase [Acidovorax delafieldii]MDR6766483.1 integrase [Acidovorax delafieldii]MDR6836579.1 integrase [Acidovorax delafieldii]MDR7366070.1 integrase [Acidovorax delafieldii]